MCSRPTWHSGVLAPIAGNLPYYITSPILERTLRLRPPRAVFLLQKEVAHRLVARPGSRDYGYLTVATGLFATARLLCEVPPSAFGRRPKWIPHENPP
jgi:16S rRNA (adenine1518-N6/adenine1519-N6)-dimethyltransferase